MSQTSQLPQTPQMPPAVQSGAAAKPGPGPRQVRRRRLLLWSTPAVLVAVLLAAKLLSLPLLASAAGSAYQRGDGDGTYRAGQSLKVANLVEPYKAPFAAGDGLALAGNNEGARGEFEQALPLANPAEACMVRVNLALTIEKLGDAKTAAGDTAGAKVLYQEGIAVTDDADPGCFQPQSEGNGQGEGQALTDAKDRLEQKAGNPGSGQQDKSQGSASSPPTPAPEQQSKLDQLKQQQKGAQKERSDGETMDKNLDSQPGGYQEKGW